LRYEYSTFTYACFSVSCPKCSKKQSVIVWSSLNVTLNPKAQEALFTQTKADILAQLKSERDPARPSPKFSTEGVRSRVEGDTVILTGRVVQTMERGGQTRTMQMRYIDRYRKRQSGWQVISSELSRIQPE
jgi:ketosteroid isomerase-like protein